MSLEKQLLLPPGRPVLAPGIICSQFSVQADAGQGFLAWQQRMDPVYDLRPAEAAHEQAFAASLRRYSIGNLSFFDICTSPNVAERSLGRVSTQSVCDISFSLFLEGRPAQMKGYAHRLDAQLPSAPSVLVQDLGQPSVVESFHGRMLIFFVPRALVEEVFPDAASLHGRRVEATTPLTRMLVAHLLTLNEQIVGLDKEQADSAYRTGIQLLATAFSQQAGLSGSARAAVRTAVYGQVRRYVEAHLHDHDLSPERILQQLQLSRASVYSLFAEEGGLAAYIRSRRLRAAASELVHFPHLAVKDIALGLGFNNASSFTRAFRRAYDMAPQDLHAYAALSARRRAASQQSSR